MKGDSEMLNIVSGKVPRAQKVVLYGPEGIGKTTLAAQTPDPLFIDTEGGSTHLDVRRVQTSGGWLELLSVIREVAAAPSICKTLVIDTADWAEQICTEYILKKYNQPGIEAFGYGKGYTFLSEAFAELLSACDDVIQSGKHVVITAHAKMRKQELPDEAGAFDRWELKLSRQTAPLLKEWADALLFLSYKTIVVAVDANHHKAQGGKRVIYTSHSPVWDAKNRHGLPAELELSYDAIAPIFDAAGETPLQQLEAAMQRDGIAPAQLQTVVAARGKFPPDKPYTDYPDEFIRGWALKYWAQVVDMAKKIEVVEEQNNG